MEHDVDPREVTTYETAAPPERGSGQELQAAEHRPDNVEQHEERGTDEVYHEEPANTQDWVSAERFSKEPAQQQKYDAVAQSDAERRIGTESPSIDLGEDRQTEPGALAVVRGLRVQRGSGQEVFTLDVPELLIRRGSFTSILGRSGCGKTTLLMVLGLLRGFQEDDEFRMSCDELSFHLAEPLPGETKARYLVAGEAHWASNESTVDDRQLETLRSSLIGFCLQGGELLPSLPLHQNVEVTGQLCDHSDAGERAIECLEHLDLSAKLHHLPAQLSGGQQQRGVVARALVHRPQLIILDEPTSSLDPDTAAETLRLLRDEARAYGQTVVMVTHDHVLAEEFSDEIFEMNTLGKGSGGIVASRQLTETIPEAEPEELYRPTPSFRRRRPYLLLLGLMDAIGPPFSLLLRTLSRDVEHRDQAFSLLRSWSSYTFVLQLCKNSLPAIAIGLLILLLRGIGTGLVREFQHDLVRSPTARELTITPPTASTALGQAGLDELQRQYPEIDVIIPSVTHTVMLQEEGFTEEASVTLAGTLPEDPKLALLHEDGHNQMLNRGSTVLSSAVAASAQVSVGDAITFWVTRDLDAKGEQRQSLPLELQVFSVIEGPGRTAYTHLEVMEQIDRFKAGRPVAERAWPGFPRPVEPRYASLLLFTRQPLSARETRVLRSRGLEALPLSGDDAAAHLYGAFQPEADLAEQGREMPLCYQVLSRRQEEDLGWLSPSILDIGDSLVDGDGIVLPWNEPLDARLDGTQVQLVGLSGSSRWLRGFLKHRRAVFPAHHLGWEATLGDRTGQVVTTTLIIGSDERQLELPLDVHMGQTGGIQAQVAAGSGPKAGPAVLVVPAGLLAQLHMYVSGLATPDHEQRLFRSVADEREYYTARVFVDDVFQVAELHERLAERFLVQSDESRVREVIYYSDVLNLLVSIVTWLALGIALFTMYVIFHDISESKQKMIATLRTMGLPRGGVGVLLLTRSLLVALVASGFLVLLGMASSVLLNLWREGICLLSNSDYLEVVIAAAAICVLGTIVPAWQLSSLDPALALERARHSS